MRRVVAGALAAGLAMSACGSEDLTLRGQISVLNEANSLAEGRACADIIRRVPTEVVVRDGKGELIAKSPFVQGEWHKVAEEPISTIAGVELYEMECLLSFEFTDITDVDFYVIQMDGEEDGEVRYSREELDDADWVAELTLDQGRY